MKNCSRIGNAIGSNAAASSHTRGGAWAGLLSKRACALGAALAAAQLEISYHTADGYIREIYEKLQVRNRSGVVAKALKEKLV